MPITNQILQRTFKIRNNNSYGTCFTVDVNGKRYLVTAQHLVDQIKLKSSIEIMHDDIWKPIGVELVGHGEGTTDISVLAPQELFGPSHELTFGPGFYLSEEVYFIGFPYGLHTNVGNLNQNYPLPLIKTAIVSATDKALIYLDGHNNFGFSGGPVFRKSEQSELLGVISGYRYDDQFVLDKNGKKGPYIYRENSGIIIAYSVEKAKNIISNNPIGIDIPKPQTK